MKRVIKFPSIEQFRGVVKQIQERACYLGKDEDGKAVFDYLKPKPTLTFTASEKIHGTNASVCYSIPDGMWAQSRENIITVEKDNAGFAFFVSQNEEALANIIMKLAGEYNIDLNTHIISLYGEWAGGNIQKNSAMSGLDKAFIIFEHFKVSPIEPSEDEKAVWFKTQYRIYSMDLNNKNIEKMFSWAKSSENKIYNVMDFPTYSFTIDFNAPERSVNEMIKLVEEVIEPASPLGKAFGKEENIGEGVVCTHLMLNLVKINNEISINGVKVTDMLILKELEFLENGNYLIDL